jgi:hypothetical protein
MSIIGLPGCSPVDDVSHASTNVSSLPPPSSVAAHALVFQRQHGELTQLALPPLSSGGRDGLVLISIGRGIASATHAPVDSISGLLATAIGEPHRYTKYPESGTALYSIPMPNGAPARTMITRLPAGDELTMAAVHVGRSHVQDVAWKEAYPGKIFRRNTVRSPQVRTSGPATLVAFWWGDAGVRGEKTAVPGQGFRVLDAVLFEGALVQCAVAVKEVDAAGSYDVSWTATPRQAAQLWLIALQ